MIELASPDDEEKKAAEALRRRKSEDFEFMVVCASKDNMAMYHLLGDKPLDKPKEPQ